MALRIVSLGRGSGVMGTLSARGSCDGDRGIVCLVLMGVEGGEVASWVLMFLINVIKKTVFPLIPL